MGPQDNVTKLLRYLLLFCAAWHLDRVEVMDEMTGEEFFFHCNQWFSRKEGDGKIERELIASAPSKDAAKGMYKVCFRIVHCCSACFGTC